MVTLSGGGRKGRHKVSQDVTVALPFRQPRHGKGSLFFPPMTTPQGCVLQFESDKIHLGSSTRPPLDLSRLTPTDHAEYKSRQPR